MIFIPDRYFDLQGRPPKPKTCSELLNVPEKYKKTLGGLSFLEYAAPAVTDENAVMMIYLSDAGKHLLQTYQSWSGDGTFSSAPDMFHQVRCFISSNYSNLCFFQS